jgi:HEAT repeat protein
VEGVQVLACLGFGRLGSALGKDVPRRLAAVVRDDQKSDLTRAACAFALGAAREPAHVDVLLQTLGEGNDDVQRTSAWALGRLRDPKGVPVLFRAYFAQSEQVREAAAWALSQMIEEETPRSIDIPEYPMLHGRFDARSAIDSLFWPLGHATLQTQSVVGREDIVAASIRDALGKHRDIIVRVLTELDQNANEISLGTRSDVAAAQPREREACAAIGKALSPTLTTLLEHRDPTVRRLSLSVLAKTDVANLGDAILRGLGDDSAAVRAQAMLSAAVYARRTPAAAESLLAGVTKRLDDDRWQDRVAAARALGAFGKSGVVRPLIRALRSDANSFVRETAAESLGAIGNVDAVPALIDSIAHTREPIGDVRAAALRALALLSPKSAREHLSRVESSDPSAKVRTLARELMGREKP